MRQTRDELITEWRSSAGGPFQLLNAIATLISGKNPDGTDWYIPTVAMNTSGGLSAANTPCTAHDLGTATSQITANAGLRFCGFSVVESAQSPSSAMLAFHNGMDANAPTICTVRLSASESAREFFGETGIKAENGIFVERISGTAKVVIFSKVV